MEQTTAREIKTFSLTLDMMRAMRSHPFEVVAGDTGNVLEVRLENDGAPVPLSGRYVCMVFRSGIGTALQDTDSGITLGEETGTFSIALLPYVITMACVSFVMFVIAGFVQNAFICLPLGAALTIGVLIVLKKKIGKSVKDLEPFNKEAAEA